jgi:regulator of nucleoside diphosphate kinase
MEGLLSAPRDAGALLQEIGRARVLDDREIDAATVVVGSRVTFRRDGREPPEEITLVLHVDPGEASRQISALTNLGAGLLGLSKGQTIRWPDRVGGSRELTILEAVPPSARLDDRPDEGAPATQPRRRQEGEGEVVPFRRRARDPAPGDDSPPSAA